MTCWRHQMETLFTLLAIHKGQWRGALMFSLICVGINGWVNNREAGDLRRYGTHYDVSVMEAGPTLLILKQYAHLHYPRANVMMLMDGDCFIIIIEQSLQSDI